MFFSVALVLLSASFGLASPNAPFRLRVEYMKNPQGVDVDYKPRLSWALCMYIKLYKETTPFHSSKFVRADLHLQSFFPPDVHLFITMLGICAFVSIFVHYNGQCASALSV